MNTSYYNQHEISNLTKENEQLIQEINRLTTRLHENEDYDRKSALKKLKQSSLLAFSMDKTLWQKSSDNNSNFAHAKTQSSYETKLQETLLKNTKSNPKPELSSTDTYTLKNDTPFEGSNVNLAKASKTSQSSSHPTNQRKPSRTFEDASHRPKDDEKEKRRLSERLIGEIAFQLDKRILHNIFSHRKRLYGFTVRNISEKIDEYTRDNGMVEIDKRESLRAKRDSTMTFLSRAAGYDPKRHPLFAEMIINKYGVLRVTKGKSEEEYRNMMSEEKLKSVIVSTVDAECTYDALTLLNSLLAFSKLDGKPLFLW